MNLFVYGTLKERDLLSFVLRRKYTLDYSPATLKDFVLKKPHYFMIFEKPGEKVDGLIVFGLSTSDFQHLDLYEGVEVGLYRRKEVQVECESTESKQKRFITTFVYYNGEDAEPEA